MQESDRIIKFKKWCFKSGTISYFFITESILVSILENDQIINLRKKQSKVW
jgi:hypothetical protein